MRETRRYLGLELAGAKNQKTALAILEYYPREKKIFLLDLFDRIQGEPQTPPSKKSDPYGVTTSGDEALLELIAELLDDTDKHSVQMGVNVPLTLPPGITFGPKPNARPTAAVTASVKWMKDALKKAEKQAKSNPSAPRPLEFTTYTQRPVELWIRYQVMNKLPESHRFEIDETLGGNKAPLTARMNFLRRHLGNLPIIEAWPKLTISILAAELKLPKRLIETYRHLEQGAHAREEILEALCQQRGLFIYERDIHKLGQSLPAFDAFICAFTALLADNDQCAQAPASFPIASGWVQYPHTRSPERDARATES